jgi:hypothetical protein
MAIVRQVLFQKLEQWAATLEATEAAVFRSKSR